MMTLKRDGSILVPRLEVATSFWARAKGLLGRRELPVGSALWIKPCNSVHTFFMKFPIDLIFLDRDLRVVKTHANVPAGRLTLPLWSATSVVELPAGVLAGLNVQPGEQLHVDPAVS